MNGAGQSKDGGKKSKMEMKVKRRTRGSIRPKRSEVAALAGVSEATVSYVFSNKRYVSPALRERVMAAADELDYRPDMIAGAMITNRTNTIAVLTNDIASPLQMEVVKGIQKAAMSKDYFVNVCGGTANLERYIDNFIARRVDGVFVSVVSSFVSEHYLKKLLDRDISVIITSMRHVSDDRICGLELDFNRGMYQIIDHLIGLGHKKIAYLSGFDRNYSDDQRLFSFYAAMRDRLGNDEPLVEEGESPYDSTVQTGYALMKRLMARTRDFTAVVCTNDMMASGAMGALAEAGLRVPYDVSVVGMDDIQFAQVFNPPLTTISHRSEEYGEKIFDILYDNIRDKSVVRREVIEPELIVRRSTGPCRNG